MLERLSILAAILIVVAVLAFQWFAADLFRTPACDPSSSPVHCTTVSGPGPGNGR
jgi:hypothetical protein